MQSIKERKMDCLEDFESIDLLNSVASDIIQVISKYPDAKSVYKNLDLLYKNYTGYDSKLMYNFILSAIAQTKSKPFTVRYNLCTDDSKYIKEISDAIKYNKLHELNCKKYSLVTQHSLNLIRGYYTGRLQNLSRYIYLPMDVVISSDTCKRCYDETSEVLCSECKSKLEKATNGQLSSFSTIGTTIEPFSHRFKDWYVVVDGTGLYNFERLDTSLEQYQMQIPFEESKNLQILIG